jgi:hypothetical protein
MICAYAYNANRFKHNNLQDLQSFCSFFQLTSTNVSLVDRTNIIQIPVKVATPPQLVLPKYDPEFSMTYEECCQSTVLEILGIQDKLSVPIRLLYSGGIDSSLILISFIKQLGLEETRRRVQLVMSPNSIDENPWLYEKVIRRGNWTVHNSDWNGIDWGTDRILVGGEFNDQILGSDMYRDITLWRGNGIMDQLWTEEMMVMFGLHRGLNIQDAELWAELLFRLVATAPCEIKDAADFWWWINFTCKWSSVYFRIMFYAQENNMIDQQYLDDYYYQFYGNENFQKWAMVDTTSKHKGTYLNYKWLAKQLVCQFLGHDEYMKKVKRGSLWKLISYKRSVDIIENNYNYIYECDPMDWYEPVNDFKRL